MREAGIEVIDTDSVAKQLMESSDGVRKLVTDLLGAEAYAGGTLDRAYVAKQIFGNGEKRLALERIVHPAVTTELERRFAAAEAGSIVAVESALILQSPVLVDLFDYIVLVDSPDEAVIARALSSGKLTEEDARKRLNDQHYSGVRRDAVDITIQNGGTMEEFVRRSKGVIELLKLMAMRDMPEVPLHALAEEEEFEEDELSSEDVDDGPGVS